MRAILVSVDYADILALTLPLNRHHFSDVMVAATIGVIGGIFIWHWISQKHLDFRRRSSVRPLIIAPKPLEQS